jgi:ABC-type nitrate/sulfonate/bicarbonate transport system ATPase subunit
MATGPAVSLDLTAMQFGGAPPLFGALRLDVAPGEVVALIGPSGVGKTTLLRIIGGLERDFAGHCRVGGVPAHLAPGPGFVFQDARLLPWLDAAGNLRAVRPDLGPAEIERLLAGVGLGGLSAAFPRQLSGGMQRRLGLARALAVDPGLLLLDEPFVSLDQAVVRDLQSLFQTVFRTRTPTVILVSHDPEDAARLADRVVVLAGRPARVTADLRLGPADGPDALAGRMDRILDVQHEVLP